MATEQELLDRIQELELELEMTRRKLDEASVLIVGSRKNQLWFLNDDEIE